MTITDPDKVPATPVYTITITSSGTATVDGEEITTSGSADEARLAALAEVRIKAALAGRPVRAVAKDQDGSAWPLIVAVDGTVTTLDRPHPTPPPAPAQTPPPLPTTTPAVLHPPPMTTVREEAARAETQASAPSAPDWGAPLPPAYGLLWGQLVAHEKAGALVEAIITADQLETALAGQYGPHHPHTVNVLSTRAWLTLRKGAEWAEVTELLLDTAERRQEAKAQPETDTARTTRNAHAAWCRLRAEDPETALDLSERLLGLLDGDELRARDIVRWVSSGAARPGGA
ncbi:hypothetical protein AB0B15_38260 [Streptomyces sp. NPDC045456]|uniref:hypothetical protein n=1 Tax=Streptomyces sp. NPDC045456 TaxID=3155254 RepID=UPI0033C95427